MHLPTVKNVVRITYTYKNGQRYFIEGKEVAKFFSQISAASILGFVHGQRFEALKWKRKEK